MIVPLLALLAAAQQDTGMLAVPVYRNAAFGVALPRPFDDWVFEPATSRQTTTVIFHPRDASLREQLWGALVMTRLGRDLALGRLADQRVETSWRPTFGSSFLLRARDSISLLGLPAIHLVMGGAISHAVVDIEEYLVGRDSDLVLLQFRYPRGLPKDSIAAGYQRMLDGLSIRGAPGGARAGSRGAAAPSSRASWREVRRALAGSPWRARAVDALQRLDTLGPQLGFAVRLELVNAGTVPADSVGLWLWPGAIPDSARTTVGRAIRLAGRAGRPGGAGGPAQRVALGAEVPPGGEAALTVFFHAGRQDGLSANDLILEDDWIPRVEPFTDTAGAPLRVALARRTTRFDIPATLAAVAPGRLTSDASALGRRRMTWVADDSSLRGGVAAFGRYGSGVRRVGQLTIRFWVPDSLRAGLDSLAALIGRGWAFYSRAFGPLPFDGISVVLANAPQSRGGPGILVLGRDAAVAADGAAATRDPRDVILRELARSWWGGAIAAAGAGSAWLEEGLPAWSSIAARGVLEGDSVRQRLVREAESAWQSAVRGRADPVLAQLTLEADAEREVARTKGAAAIEAARRAVGEARFREAIRALAVEHRGGWVALADLISLLGPDGAAVLRPYILSPTAPN